MNWARELRWRLAYQLLRLKLLMAPPPPLAGVVWNKATRSNGNGGNNCVEVAFLDAGVAVRDSKDRTGPALFFTAAEWDAFTGGVKDGEFNLRT